MLNGFFPAKLFVVPEWFSSDGTDGSHGSVWFCLVLLPSQEAGRDGGASGGCEPHLTRHRIQTALAAGKGLCDRSAPHGRRKGERS